MISSLEELAGRVTECHDCELSRRRNRAVPGEGPANASVMFIGEAPGFNEDQQGRPFVGAAGQYLTQLLGIAGLRRNDVYICNVIKCRPPDNRDPLPTEIQACRKWLDDQIELIKPKVVVTLGRYSMARYFSGAAISKAHGKHVKRDGVIYFALYHPAAALHQQSLKKTIEEDMLKLRDVLAEAQNAPEEAKGAQQLSMF